MLNIYINPTVVAKRTTIDAKHWLKSSVENMHVSIMIMSVCTVRLPVGHAVLHGVLKVSVELKEVRCTQHSAIPLRQERNYSTLCSHSTLVTQALSRKAQTHSQWKTRRRNKTSCLTWVRGVTREIRLSEMLLCWNCCSFDLRCSASEISISEF